MERMEFDLLIRWFVGLGADEPVWDASTYIQESLTACSRGMWRLACWQY